MARSLAAFDLHEWHNQNDPVARHPIGASGIPRAAIAPYLPSTYEAWEKLWSTPPNAFLAQLQSQLSQIYGFDPTEILITQGASEADFLIALALTRPGDRVVIEKPAYFALLEPARALGCKVVRVNRDPSNEFRLPIEKMERAMTRGTKLAVLARPNNPTGARATGEELGRVADAAQRVQAHVLVDEVFAEATKEGDVAARRLHPSILSVNSITKCMGFGPMHVGWVAAPRNLTKRLLLAKEHVRPLNAILGLGLASRILPHRAKILKATRKRRADNAATLRRFLRDSRLAGHVPEHGTTLVARLPSQNRNDVAFARRLLERDGVLVAPGAFLELPGWIRIGLLSEPDHLKAGLDAIDEALA